MDSGSDKDTATLKWRIPDCCEKYLMEEDIAISQDVVETSSPFDKRQKQEKNKAKYLKRKLEIRNAAEREREEFKQLLELRRELENRMEKCKDLMKLEKDRIEKYKEEMKMEKDRIEMQLLEKERMKDMLDIHRLRTEYQLSAEQLQAHEDRIMFMDTSKLNPSEIECITVSRIQIARDHGIHVSLIRSSAISFLLKSLLSRNLDQEPGFQPTFDNSKV